MDEETEALMKRKTFTPEEIIGNQYLVAENVRRGKFGLPKTGKRLIDIAESVVPKLEAHIRMLA
jgi:hypothetical protein